MFEFATAEWGPQPLRLMLAATDCNAISLGVAKDTGVKEVKDLKGKRVGMVVGSPALNQNAFAVLAFAGLTKNDVKLVEFSSYGAMWKGILNNEVDAAIASTISGQAKEAEASPRGLVFPPTPAADKAGWARVNADRRPTTCRTRPPAAPGISAQNPVELPYYPYPIFMAYASQPADLVHGITKAMIVNYDDYKDGAPGADGLELSRQNFTWQLPYHEGAVKAFQRGRRLEARARGAQQAADRAPGQAGRGVVGVHQDQPARRRRGVPQGLDGGACGGIEEGRLRPRVRVKRGARSGHDDERRPTGPSQAPAVSDLRSDPHLAAPLDAEVTRVRALRGAWRWLLMASALATIFCASTSSSRCASSSASRRSIPSTTTRWCW